MGDAALLLVGTFRDTEGSAPHPLLTILGEGAGGGGVDLLEEQVAELHPERHAAVATQIRETHRELATPSSRREGD